MCVIYLSRDLRTRLLNENSIRSQTDINLSFCIQDRWIVEMMRLTDVLVVSKDL